MPKFDVSYGTSSEVTEAQSLRETRGWAVLYR